MLQIQISPIASTFSTMLGVPATTPCKRNIDTGSRTGYSHFFPTLGVTLWTTFLPTAILKMCRLLNQVDRMNEARPTTMFGAACLVRFPGIFRDQKAEC